MDILGAIAVPVSGIITYILGHMAGIRKEHAKTDSIELHNYQKVVDFYKSTFEDLREEIEILHKEILKLTEENITLKHEINKLNEILKKKL